MAKDGTRRGGARPGAGRKKKQKPESVESVLEAVQVAPEEAAEFPRFNPLLSEPKGSLNLDAAEAVYLSIYKYARDSGAAERLPKELVELFAVAYSRWAQAENEISKNGFISPHPTTGADCKSPLVEVSNIYSKQAQNYWYSIWTAVKDAAPTTAGGDGMEELLDGV